MSKQIIAFVTILSLVLLCLSGCETSEDGWIEMKPVNETGSDIIDPKDYK
jgi:hypothetical protein